MEEISKETLELLMDGKLTRSEVDKIVRQYPKDERFWKYLEILQTKVPWKEKILFRLGEHLYIVSHESGGRIVKCECGEELGDYRVNWKLQCLVRVRKTEEEFAEVFTGKPTRPNPEIMEVREFYCPSCLTQHAVEIVPPGYPIIFEQLPDLDVFYRDWLNAPLKDESSEWFKDNTFQKIAAWATEKER